MVPTVSSSEDWSSTSENKAQSPKRVDTKQSPPQLSIEATTLGNLAELWETHFLSKRSKEDDHRSNKETIQNSNKRKIIGNLSVCEILAAIKLKQKTVLKKKLKVPRGLKNLSRKGTIKFKIVPNLGINVISIQTGPLTLIYVHLSVCTIESCGFSDK